MQQIPFRSIHFWKRSSWPGFGESSQDRRLFSFPLWTVFTWEKLVTQQGALLRNLQAWGTLAAGAPTPSALCLRGLHAWLSSSPRSPLERGKRASPPASLRSAPWAGGAEGRPAQSQLAASHMQAQQDRPNFLVSIILCGCAFPRAASGESQHSWHKQTAPRPCS